jgi:hypothetical protein
VCLPSGVLLQADKDRVRLQRFVHARVVIPERVDEFPTLLAPERSFMYWVWKFNHQAELEDQLPVLLLSKFCAEGKIV